MNKIVLLEAFHYTNESLGVYVNNITNYRTYLYIHTQLILFIIQLNSYLLHYS